MLAVRRSHLDRGERAGFRPVQEGAKDQILQRNHGAVVFGLCDTGAVVVAVQLRADEEIVEEAGADIDVEVRDHRLQVDEQSGRERRLGDSPRSSMDDWMSSAVMRAFTDERRRSDDVHPIRKMVGQMELLQKAPERSPPLVAGGGANQYCKSSKSIRKIATLGTMAAWGERA